MKKLFTILLTAIALVVSCDNHEEIWNELRDHEQRIEQLEKRCRELNTNIEAIQAILTAIQQNDYVTEVMKIMEDGVEVGYSITFAPKTIAASGEMAIVGPRPALWNQFDLIAERDKYGANDVLPGLTGWAQINGRDELPIDVKARLDGEYVEKLSFLFDCRCFFGTILSVLRSDGVVEGGTGQMEKEKKQQ